MTTPSPVQSQPVGSVAKGPTIYFDGGCPVCTSEMAVYRRQPGAQACNWVDASRCDESAFGTDLNREAALKRLHVRLPDGRLAHGARGFAAMWMALPRTAWLGRVANLAPVAAVLEVAYRIFLYGRRAWRKPPGPSRSGHPQADRESAADAVPGTAAGAASCRNPTAT